MPTSAKRFSHRTSLCALLVMSSLALAGSIGCHPAPQSPAPASSLPNDVDALVDFLSVDSIGKYKSYRCIDRSKAIDRLWLLQVLDRQTTLKLLHHPSPAVRVWIAGFVIANLHDDVKEVLPLLEDRTPIPPLLWGCFRVCTDGVVEIFVGEQVSWFLDRNEPDLLKQAAPDASPP